MTQTFLYTAAVSQFETDAATSGSGLNTALQTMAVCAGPHGVNSAGEALWLWPLQSYTIAVP